MELISYHEPGTNDLIFVYVNRLGISMSPYFKSDQEAEIWLSNKNDRSSKGEKDSCITYAVPSSGSISTNEPSFD